MGSTTIESAPKRVVALDPSYIDAALLLGADLVGYVQYRQDPKAPFAPYLGDVADATKDSVNVGTLAEPNLEKILELQPDLIVSAKVRHEALYPQLSKIAPTIFSVSTGPTWKENVVFLGRGAGQEGQGRRAGQGLRGPGPEGWRGDSRQEAGRHVLAGPLHRRGHRPAVLVEFLHRRDHGGHAHPAARGPPRTAQRKSSCRSRPSKSSRVTPAW